MTMIPTFCFSSLRDYIDNKGEAEFERPEVCPNPSCMKRNCFWKHGTYERRVCEEANTETIKVQRLICKYCRKAVSCLYVFLVPYRQFTTQEIAMHIEQYLTQEKSYRNLAGAIEPVDDTTELPQPCHPTIWRWVEQFGQAVVQSLWLHVQRLVVMAGKVVEEHNQQCPNEWKAQSERKREQLRISTKLLKLLEMSFRAFGKTEHLVKKLYTRFLMNTERPLAILSGRHIRLLTTHSMKHSII